MSTFRLAALGILAVLAAVYGYYLLQQTQPVPPPAHKPVSVIAMVMPDGAISINGQRFSDPVTLKAKMGEYRKAGSEPEVHLLAPQNTKFETVGRSAMLLQKAGVAKVGFITEPRRVNDK
jgi:biopolymer transport protein ExbD